MAFRRSRSAAAGGVPPELVALRMLGRRSLTRRELEARLNERGYSSAEAARATEVVAERCGLPEDSEIVRRSLESRADQRGFGRRRLVAEALKRGLSRDEAERVAGTLRDDEADLAAMTRELERLTLGMKQSDLEDGRARRRIGARLIRKGFSPSMVARALSSIASD